MLQDIIEARPLHDWQLCLRFEDGAHGTVDVAKLVRFDGVFELLRERAYFVQVRVDPELGTVCWPNGADLDPDVLYSQITGEPLPGWVSMEAQHPTS